LGAAAAFLGPSRTGSFWESLGAAAKGYAAGEEQSAQQQADLAKMQMDVAAQSLDIERQKQSDEAFNRYLRGEPVSPGSVSGLSPQGVGQYLAQPAAQAGQTSASRALGTNGADGCSDYAAESEQADWQTVH
jgi:hypothetical protein